MSIGTVKWFNATKGYGFIQPDDGSKDVFLHISDVEQRQWVHEQLERAGGEYALSADERKRLSLSDGEIDRRQDRCPSTAAERGLAIALGDAPCFDNGHAHAGTASVSYRERCASTSARQVSA